jgi:hypothetical protein
MENAAEFVAVPLRLGYRATASLQYSWLVTRWPRFKELDVPTQAALSVCPCRRGESARRITAAEAALCMREESNHSIGTAP